MDPEERRVKRSYRTLATRNEKMYLGIAAWEALVVIAVAFAVFGLIEANVEASDAKERTVPVYVAIFIFAQLFSLIYVFDALRARNIIQLVLHLIFNTCIWVYSILQVPQTEHALSGLPADRCGSFAACVGPNSLFTLVKKLFIVTPVVLGLCTVGFAVLIRMLYVEFGWAVFHLVGASPDMKKMHKEYQTLISLLKLLLFFALAFCIAYTILINSGSKNRAEFSIITIIALPLTVLSMFACGWALRKENKPVMGICLVLMVAGLVYFIYKLTSMWLPATESLYINTKVTLALFSIFAIIILMVTFIFGCLCMSNFGKGLIQAHRNPENKTSLWAIPANTRYQEKVRADVEAELPTVDRLVID